jgi:hypothetical protein
MLNENETMRCTPVDTTLATPLTRTQIHTILDNEIPATTHQNYIVISPSDTTEERRQAMIHIIEEALAISKEIEVVMIKHD